MGRHLSDLWRDAPGTEAVGRLAFLEGGRRPLGAGTGQQFARQPVPPPVQPQGSDDAEGAEGEVKGVRFRVDVGFEGKCDRCLEWWPLIREHWDPRQGLARCVPCIREIAQVKTRLRRSDPETRAYDREAIAMKRRANREAYLAARRDYYRKNREHILALRRNPAPESDERRRAKRDWIRTNRSKLDGYYREQAA